MHPLGHRKSFKNNGSEPRLDIKSSGELLKVLLPRSQANQLNQNLRGFPGGAVENLPANAGDAGSSPGLGGSHMPRSN